jgi:hypothetical protein
VFLDTDDAGSVERDLGVGGLGATMRFVPGQRGRVSGPGVTLPAGSYTAEFQLKLEAPAIGPVADLDVPANRRRSGPRRLTAVDFTDLRCQPFTLPFELPGETAGLDFRTRSYGAALSPCRVVVRKSPP